MNMLLGIDFNNCVSIRRKAYDVDNPVQPPQGGSSGWKNVSYLPATPLGVELRRSSRDGESSLTPSCPPSGIARGYPHLRPSVLLLKTVMQDVLI